MNPIDTVRACHAVWPGLEYAVTPGVIRVAAEGEEFVRFAVDKSSVVASSYALAHDIEVALDGIGPVVERILMFESEDDDREVLERFQYNLFRSAPVARGYRPPVESRFLRGDRVLRIAGTETRNFAIPHDWAVKHPDPGFGLFRRTAGSSFETPFRAPWSIPDAIQFEVLTLR
jgi:hypothetical protein